MAAPDCCNPARAASAASTSLDRPARRSENCYRPRQPHRAAPASPAGQSPPDAQRSEVHAHAPVPTCAARQRLALLITATALGALPAKELGQQATAHSSVVLHRERWPISGGSGYVASATSTELKSGAPLTGVPQTGNTVT